MNSSPVKPWQWSLAFVALFAAYQAPQGLGMQNLMLAVVPLAWLLARLLGFKGMDAWYLSFSPRWFAGLLGTFLFAMAVKFGAIAAGAALDVYRVSPAAGAGVGGVPVAALLILLPFTFIPSISEDILTRGFVARALPRLAANWLIVPISAAVYVLNHIYRLANGPLEWITLFAFGVAYAAALYRTGSLWPAVGLHWGWNFANGVLDRLFDVEVVSTVGAPLVSVAAHVLMLAVVLGATQSAAVKEHFKLSGRRSTP
ncbi:CPBP family intramembrane glutamic endopeptidase [Pseudoduganella sp. OTU4001]|uniref:CPBP family intramembrane glutamic endopeptidase n=1 Tax=Pseudoduganella sp. OTU4001 TaxID=3043854 RepID=UPI00313C17AC